MEDADLSETSKTPRINETPDIYCDQGVCRFSFDSKSFNLFSRLKEFLDNEKFTLEGLEISTKVIELNPQHYTAWYFRRKVIQENLLPNSENQKFNFLQKELSFVRDICEKTPKCYQNWWHMRKIREWIGLDINELNYLNKLIESDAKNMYAWSYRTWFIRNFKAFDKVLYYKELEYVSSLIIKDCRNNGAWCFRNFIFEQLKKINELEEYDIAKEINYIIYWLRCSPHNDSIWNYIISFFSRIISNETSKTFHKKLSFEKAPKTFKDTINELFEKHKLTCYQLVYVKACIAFEENQENLVLEALQLLQIIDPIRRFYWKWRINNFKIPNKISK